MKKLFTLLFFAFLTCSSAFAQDYYVVWGKVTDTVDGEPVYLSSVTLSKTNIATVTNADGVFSLKIPIIESRGASVEISHLGFITATVSIEELLNTTQKNPLPIKLTKTTIMLDPATIVALEASTVVNEAFYRVRQNYSRDYEVMTAFYRETIKKNNNKYLSMCEAILDISKAPYESIVSDRVGIYKGRGSVNYNSADTLFINYQGGVTGTLELDVVKDPFIGVYMTDVHKSYDFKFDVPAVIDNRNFYVINFNQKPTVDVPLYKGKIYIETETFAVGRIEFSINSARFPEVVSNYVVKHPRDTKFELDDTDYIINYKESEGKWYYDYGRMEINISGKKKNNLFKARYKIVSELAVTDHYEGKLEIDQENRLTYRDILQSKIDSFTDENFWEGYNVIEPDRSIDQILNTIVKQLRRRR
ncbi:MAG: carboxypeptidase-like regulatory domain-containing protein [Bacteroidales bacterium]|nr:carboxypeptidase-like regulatory domain-containing protein [Bacteroidales bacterium]